PPPRNPNPANRKCAEPGLAGPKPAEPKLAEPRPAEPKPADPLTNLVKATSAAPAASSTIVRPPAPIPLSSRNETSTNPAAGSRRVAAVQRALTQYGYGQLKPTGTVGTETQAPNQKIGAEG